MRIATAQRQVLDGEAQGAFRVSLRPHVAEYFPTVADVCGPVGVDAVIAQALDLATLNGFSGQASQRCYLDMTLLLGVDYQTDPLLAHMSHHLDHAAARTRLQQIHDADPAEPEGVVDEECEPDPIDMQQAYYSEAWDWIDRTAGEGYANLYKALARLGAMLDKPGARPGDDAAILKGCAKLFPEKAEIAAPDAMTTFLSDLRERAEQDGMTEGFAVYAWRAFIGGFGAFRDAAFTLDGVGFDADSAGADRAAAHERFVADYVARILASARKHGGA